MTQSYDFCFQFRRKWQMYHLVLPLAQLDTSVCRRVIEIECHLTNCNMTKCVSLEGKVKIASFFIDPSKNVCCRNELIISRSGRQININARRLENKVRNKVEQRLRLKDMWHHLRAIAIANERTNDPTCTTLLHSLAIISFLRLLI